MTRVRFGLSLCLLLGMSSLVGCATISVNTDYDDKVDFSQYHSFNFVEQSTTNDPSVSPFTLDRIQQATEAQLTAAGYVKDTNNPDFLIAFHLGKQDKVDVNSYGYGYRGWGGGVDVYEYTEGTLIMDFVDAKENKAIWRATAKGTVGDSGTDTGKINEAIAAMIAKYPPK